MKSAPSRWLLPLLVTALFGVSTAFSLAASDGNFSSGNDRYAAGDYVGAVKAYEAQVKQGSFSANLFYNLGDADYRLGDKGRAILNYRRALLLEPSHAEAAANLAFVNGGKTSRDRQALSWMWDVAPWMAAVCGWLAVTGGLIAMMSRKNRVPVLVFALGSLLAGIVVVGLTLFFDGRARGDSQAIVLAEATPALYSPADNSKVITTLPAGGEVRILSEQGAWIYAALGDGTTRAWLAADKVERLVPR